MTKYISFLRGINVGGRRKILMADLKKLYEELRFSDSITYIQSGNVIFSANDNADTRKLAEKIEKAIFSGYNFEVPVIVRTVKEMEQTISNNPFLAQNEIERLYLTFLKEIPELDKLDKTNEINFHPDEFKTIEKDVFIYCSGMYSDSKLSNKFFENKLNVVATSRSWKTVLQLFSMASKP